MAISMSRPAKPFKVTKTPQKVHRKTSEERRQIQRKVDSIRREAHRKHLEITHGRIDVKMFRSPKVLIGIVLTFVILGVLITTAFQAPAVQHRIDPTPARITSVRRSLSAVAQAMTYYRVHTKTWPAQDQGLWALARNPKTVPNWRGPYINAPFRDPWKQPLVYVMPISPFEAPTLYSCGPDTLPNTDDDIIMTPDDFFCSEGTWRRDPEPTDTPNSSPTSIESTPL